MEWRRWELVLHFADGGEVHLIGNLDGGVMVDKDPPTPYDPDFGDYKMCECGHIYYRHFDTYEQMRPVGCKYCGSACSGFRLADEQKEG